MSKHKTTTNSQVNPAESLEDKGVVAASESETQTTETKTTENAPAVTLPASQPQIFRTPAKGKTMRVTCEPGKQYSMLVGSGDTSFQVPFALPPECKESTIVTLASQNPNWLGRDGRELRAHVCVSERGTVILQPHDGGLQAGWKANVFTNGSVSLQTL